MELVGIIQSLDNVAHSKSILNDIRDLWRREFAVGFHIFKTYDPVDLRYSLSHLALMMVNRGPTLNLIFSFASHYGNIENPKFWIYQICTHQSSLNIGISSLLHHISFDQKMLRHAVSMMIQAIGNDMLIFSYTSTWLRSKLNPHNIFANNISAYISEFRVCKLVRRCKLYFTSSANILKHLLDINKILKGFRL